MGSCGLSWPTGTLERAALCAARCAPLGRAFPRELTHPALCVGWSCRQACERARAQRRRKLRKAVDGEEAAPRAHAGGCAADGHISWVSMCCCSSVACCAGAGQSGVGGALRMRAQSCAPLRPAPAVRVRLRLLRRMRLLLRLVRALAGCGGAGADAGSACAVPGIAAQRGDGRGRTALNQGMAGSGGLDG
jgi:hypothetical protein